MPRCAKRKRVPKSLRPSKCLEWACRKALSKFQAHKKHKKHNMLSTLFLNTQDKEAASLFQSSLSFSRCIDIASFSFSTPFCAFGGTLPCLELKILQGHHGARSSSPPFQQEVICVNWAGHCSRQCVTKGKMMLTTVVGTRNSTELCIKSLSISELSCFKLSKIDRSQANFLVHFRTAKKS